MSKTLRKVKDWSFIVDELHGTTTVCNPTIDFYRDWNTGTEAQEEIKKVQEMKEDEFVSYCTSEIPLPF